MTRFSEQSEHRWPVEVIRSQKRRKTISAELKQGVMVVRAPATMSDAELRPLIERLQKRFDKRMTPLAETDEELEMLARELNRKYFKSRLHWRSVRYVNNQAKRFGSCTPSQGTIRISRRLTRMPKWVQRYVVMHELAHLEEANHGPRFWQLVNQYPLTERARGYLMAIGLEEIDEEVGDSL